jgi:putative copper resistance protein D
MDKFGQLAAYIVGILVLTGAYLTIRILESPNDFLQTSYGSSLLLKLIGVAGLLLLAASNKFFIVPNLDRAISVGHLRSSISVEIMVAVLVIGTTAYFTTVVGISHG